MSASTTRRRAVLYLRLSVTTEESTSIERQERDLRDLAERERCDIVEVLVDDGISGGKRRDKASRALNLIANDEADVLMVWKLDRFGRRGLRDVVSIVDALDERAARTPSRPALFVAHDGLRSDVAMWETIASLYAGQAKQERLNTAARVRNARNYLVGSDRYAGGNLPYGYRTAPAPDGKGRVLEVDPETSAHVRAAVDYVLGGGSLYGAVKALNAAGATTSRGNNWSPGSLRKLLIGDAILGRVTHGGELVRDSHGLPREVWPPLITAEESARLRALYPPFTGANAGKPRRTRAARLLSGVLVCSGCKRPMIVGQGGKGPGGVRVARYSCSAKQGRCDLWLSANAEAVEAAVVEQLLAVVGRFEVVLRREEVRDVADRAAVEEALAETAKAMTAPGADVAALVERLNALRARRDELDAMPSAPEVVEVPTGRTYAEVWHDTDDDEDTTTTQRRELLRDALSGPIELLPAEVRGRRGFDPARLVIPWRWSAGE